MAKIWVAVAETKARAKVIFKSELTDLKRGRLWRVIVAKPGMSPKKFPSKINRKKVITQGKNTLALLPARSSTTLYAPPIIASKTFCIPVGTIFKFLVAKKLPIIKINITIQETNKVLVIGSLPIFPITSGAKTIECSILIIVLKAIKVSQLLIKQG